MKRLGFFACILSVLKGCFTNRACVSFFAMAVAFYSFYYALPYGHQLPEHLKAVVVDLDQSSVSRRFIHELRAVPQLNIVEVHQETGPAVKAMDRDRAWAVITIPANFSRDLLNNRHTSVSVVADGSFIVAARYSIQGVQGPLQVAVKAALAKEMAAGGIPLSSLLKDAQKAPPVVIQFMYNTLGGYLNFVFPIVFIIIFQTIFLCGIGMLLNDWFRQERPQQVLLEAIASTKGYLALICAFTAVIFAWILYTEGFACAYHGINSMKNISGTLTVGFIYAVCVACLGTCIAFFMGRSPLIMQCIVPTSIVMVFICGNVYPVQNMPVWAQCLGALAPSTPAVHALVRVSQADAPLSSVSADVAHILALTLVFFALGLWRARLYRRYLPSAMTSAKRS